MHRVAERAPDEAGLGLRAGAGELGERRRRRRAQRRERGDAPPPPAAGSPLVSERPYPPALEAAAERPPAPDPR